MIVNDKVKGLANAMNSAEDDQHTDGGYSLIELIVAIVIVLVIFAGTAAVMIATTTSSRTSIARAEADQDMALITESFSRAMRVAVVPPITGARNPFEVATKERVVFYAATERGQNDAANFPLKYDFSYRRSDGCIIETRTKPSRNNGTVEWLPANSTTRCVVQTSKAPEFSFMQGATSSTPPASGSGSGSTNADLLTPIPATTTTSITSPWVIRAASVTAHLNANRSDQQTSSTTVTVALIHGGN